MGNAALKVVLLYTFILEATGNIQDRVKTVKFPECQAKMEISHRGHREEMYSSPHHQDIFLPDAPTSKFPGHTYNLCTNVARL